MKKALLGLVGALVTASVTAVTLAPVAQAADAPLVVIYGDSLVAEAESYLHQLASELTGRRFKVRGAPGGALCDLLPEMEEDAGVLRPAAIVLSFSGNAFTNCMKDDTGQTYEGDALVAKYRADAERAIAVLAKTRAPIWLASSPISYLAEREGDRTVAKLAAAWRQLDAKYPQVHMANAAQAVLEKGSWTLHKPCLPNELCTGPIDARGRRVNQVRAHDTAHFCPIPYPAGVVTCPIHASGALRYALGMLIPALEGTGLFDQQRMNRSIGAGFTG